MAYYKTYDFENKIKEFSMYWDLSQEDRIKIITKLRRSKTYDRVFNKKFDLTRDFREDTIKHGLAKTDHFIYTIKGRTGSGKSSIGAIIMYWLYKDKINLDNVVFNHLYQKRLLRTMGKNNTIMRDEQTVRVGAGSIAENLEIQNWDETLRKDGINFLYIAPTDRFHGTAHKNLEFVARNKKKRISMFALYDGLENSKYYTGYVLFYIPTIKWWKENGGNFWAKYQRKKDKFNKATREDSHGIDWSFFIDEITEHKRWNKDINFNQLKAIIMELFVFQPKEIRETILTMYMARVGLKKAKVIAPPKPDKCPHCNKINMRYSRIDEAWKCNVCYSIIN